MSKKADIKRQQAWERRKRKSDRDWADVERFLRYQQEAFNRAAEGSTIYWVDAQPYKAIKRGANDKKAR